MGSGPLFEPKRESLTPFSHPHSSVSLVYCLYFQTPGIFNPLVLNIPDGVEKVCRIYQMGRESQSRAY